MLRYGIIFAAALVAFPQVPTPTNPADREKVSNMAASMLNASEQARASIAAKDKGTALHHVNEAISNALAIEAARPHAAQPLVVPLYTEMIQITVAQPALRNKPDTAKRAARSTVAQPRAVGDASGEYKRVTLNVTQAKQHLQTAKDALNRGDLTAADGDLAAVKNDVKAESMASDLPLLKARQNLALALGQVRREHYKEAATPLREAASALGEYASGKAAHAAEAAKLRQQVDELTGSIEQHAKEAENKIAQWWNQVSDWFSAAPAPER